MGRSGRYRRCRNVELRQSRRLRKIAAGMIEQLESRVMLAFGPEGAEIELGGIADRLSPSIPSSDTGNCAVVWTAPSTAAPDIYVRQYDASGGVQGQEQRVNVSRIDYHPDCQPSIAMNGSGDFVITWQGFDESDAY